ncbi:MAG: helix-turn-helix transcriptional regulator [Candidatus Dormibacteraeota bacterium]|uniref:Helix-turn-helix transcriptional regulator n=1 Tax=Candidatus Aeolococcus gillhamiae TaxID=3127015 RepID=A0A934JV66_9BACT|nr:helix-turn-helix transcriptional regulator [Candidatus Dormibacteraeota bacterium]
MPSVKPRRSYKSTLRQEQARQTRLRILEAAERCFAQQGYAGATVENIAAEAQVAADTVFAAFGKKRGILQALMDLRAGGDDEPVDMLSRPGPQAVRQERDQHRQLDLFAAGISANIERTRPAADIMSSAAAVDADIAALRQGFGEQRYRNQQVVASWVAANGPLRNGVTTDDAAAIIWTLTSPEVHRLFRVNREWSAEHYAQWLSETLTRTLLP